MHVQSSRINTKMTARTEKIISMSPNEQQPPNSPISAGPWCRNKMDSLGNVADASTTCTDVHSNQNGVRTTAKTCKTVSKTSKMSKVLDSPIARQYGTETRPMAWGTTWMGWTCAGTCNALKRMQKWLKT